MRIRGFEKHRGSRITGLENLARIPEAVYREVRIMDRIINFRLALFRYFGVSSTIFINFKSYSTERCRTTTRIERSIGKFGSFHLCLPSSLCNVGLFGQV